MNPNVTDTDIWLPGSEELPCSDDTPVDNENQNTLPNWLLAVLAEIWGDRQDWFFGVDMGIYTREAQRRRTPFVIPDGFLSLGVPRHKRDSRGRLSYVLQEEDDVVPILAVEMVSQTYGQEYHDKLAKYEHLGILYYLIYNPDYHQRHQRQPFELHKRVDGRYQQQPGEPIWMPEIGLGIGRVQGWLGGIQREWLAWHDASNQPYPLPQQMIRQLTLQLEREQQRTEQALLENRRLRERLQQLGVDPDELS
jgi:Uma2 family endonuclease